jgi:radical SAM protein with 4Fe4S-binding SPASM domain
MAATQIQQKLADLARSFHPTSVHWNLTDRCNASCGYCYVRDNSRLDLPTADMLAIADFLARNGVLFLTLSGGEIFLRPDILTILERVVINDFFSVSLMTNGLLIEQRYFDFIAAHPGRFTGVQISAFSHIPAVNDRYFGVAGALDKIVSSAVAFREMGLPVTIAVSLFDFNIGHIRETRAFFLSRGFSVNIGLMKILCDRNRRDIDPAVLTNPFFRDCLASLDDDIVRSILDDMARCSGSQEPGSENDPLCMGLTNAIALDSAGYLHPCPIFTSITIGHAFDGRSLSDMLTSSAEYVTVRNLARRDLPTCLQCRFGYFCPLCVAGRVLENGDVHVPDKQACEFALAVYERLGKERAQ